MKGRVYQSRNGNKDKSGQHVRGNGTYRTSCFDEMRFFVEVTRQFGPSTRPGIENKGGKRNYLRAGKKKVGRMRMLGIEPVGV
jgi:hypothetical protein